MYEHSNEKYKLDGETVEFDKFLNYGGFTYMVGGANYSYTNVTERENGFVSRVMFGFETKDRTGRSDFMALTFKIDDKGKACIKLYSQYWRDLLVRYRMLRKVEFPQEGIIGTFLTSCFGKGKSVSMSGEGSKKTVRGASVSGAVRVNFEEATRNKNVAYVKDIDTKSGVGKAIFDSMQVVGTKMREIDKQAEARKAEAVNSKSMG